MRNFKENHGVYLAYAAYHHLTTIQDKVLKTMKTEICETYSGIKRTFVIVVPDDVDEVSWLQYTLA